MVLSYLRTGTPFELWANAPDGFAGDVLGAGVDPAGAEFRPRVRAASTPLESAEPYRQNRLRRSPDPHSPSPVSEQAGGGGDGRDGALNLR